MRSSLFKIYFVAVLFLVFNNWLYTNDFGLKLGLSSTQLKYSHKYEEANNLAGFQAGIFHNWELYRFLFFQVEGYYNRKGNKVVDDIKFRIDYLEIPLLIKIDVAMGKRIKAGFFGGWYGAYRLGAKMVGVSRGDQRADIKNIDYGLILGISISRKFRSVDLIIDVRYSRGLENIVRWPSSEESIKHRGFAVLFGISF